MSTLGRRDVRVTNPNEVQQCRSYYRVSFAVAVILMSGLYEYIGENLLSWTVSMWITDTNIKRTLTYGDIHPPLDQARRMTL